MSESSNGGDPEPTPMDRDCAFFVRDALFPLRRDWGSRHSQGRQKHHSQIHPALDALDRLRTELVEKRPTTMSYSNVFPRGVLLVARSDALVDSSPSTSKSSTSTSTSTSKSSSSSSSSTSRMEYNGQPDVDESGATVEVVPDVLTVRCLRCNDPKFRPFTTAGENAFVRTETNPYTLETRHELVVCSDRVLRADYHRRTRSQSRSSSRSGIGSERREDLPADSLRAVEETLARAIAKLTVRSDETETEPDGDTAIAIGKPDPGFAATPTPAPRPTAIESPSLSPTNCFEYARLELLAARASECLLGRSADQTRLGSAVAPAWLVSRLPRGLQRRFAERCAVVSATKRTASASRELWERTNERPPERPRDCVRRALEDLRRSEAEGR